MSKKQFFFQLGSLTLLTALGIALLNCFPKLESHIPLASLSLLFFTGLSIVMYFVGIWAIRSKNKNDFTSIVIFFITTKMLLSVVLVLVYFRYVQPTERLFVLSFLVIYLIYTIFETHFMMKISKMKL
ncbi:MAG: hypothetical protein DHS20C18_13580 [Saprospiraceae bacterium]|nr:MAG: hypothetical protein DHS20C18_13580 [Saprospiraceae bacterium]